MRNVIILVLAFGFIQADFWEDTKTKSLEYYNKAKVYDKEYNISNQVKDKSVKYYNKTKAYDKEHNISTSIKQKATNSWNSFKSIF